MSLAPKEVITSPWGVEYRDPTYHRRTWEGHRFIKLHSSVVAVKDGVAVTECVTVDGAIRHLTRQRGKS